MAAAVAVAVAAHQVVVVAAVEAAAAAAADVEVNRVNPARSILLLILLLDSKHRFTPISTICENCFLPYCYFPALI